MSHILSERNKPSLEVVQRIISAFPELSLPWLLSGTGDMVGSQAPVAAPSSVPQPPETAETLSLAPPAPVVAAEVPLEEPATVIEPQDAPLVTPAVAPTATLIPPASSPAAAPVPAAPKPFRASALRKAVAGSTTAPTVAAPVAQPVVVPTLPANAELAVPPVPSVPAPAPVSPAPVVPPAPAASETALLPFLAEPGKAIRRIVIFYRDGSFADYQPEQ
ncbi:hypothetical protein GCM10023172_33420 [Hymenobacter ginsengisoli]|uniref:HTH cro/C1-type domain-containing protein n=2 Tax=Hymenobacter TaxID=89966 RepID=A0ABP8QN25_9BACT